ncbi:hypothetical protein YPPY15_1544, partial [Yersinia pestis PY-15]
MRLKKQIQP